MLRLHAELDRAQQEATTGQMADMGAELGAKAGRLVSFQGQTKRLEAIVGSNGIVQGRLTATQSALENLASVATSFRNSLLVDHGDVNSRAATLQAGMDGLRQLTSTLNTNVGDRFLFAGVNSDITPISSSGQGATASLSAFQAAFGMAAGDPAASAISSGAMKTFLDGDHAALFDAAHWQANWSSADDAATRSRISPSELTDSSVSANEPAFRKLAEALSMIANYGGENLSGAAYQALTTKALSVAADALNGLTQLSARTGALQQRVETANTRLNAQINLLTKQGDALTGVDPYEAATRVSSLQTQIQAAYYLTSQLRDLNLFKYL